MAIRFLTDSTADILPQEAARRDIDLVPLSVLFGETAYKDGVDLDHATFYRMLAQADRLPSTSQPTPEDFLVFFERAKQRGDSLICILLSSKISGTYQSACIARALCEYDGIHIIDSTQAVMGSRALIDLGILLRDQGMDAPAIAAELERAKQRVRLFAIVDTLEYLHKGGRLPTAVNIVGSLLKVKPLIALKDGQLGMVGKGVGTKGSLNAMLKLLAELPDRDSRLPVYYGYTGGAELCSLLMEAAQQAFGEHPGQAYPIGSVIGAHVGPGAAAVVFLAKE